MSMRASAFGAALALAGCCRQPTDQLDARCTPVHDLLTKNYANVAAFDILGQSAGIQSEATGAELSADQSFRIAMQDAACKAWVAGTLSPDDYRKMIFAALGVSIAALPPEQRPAATAAAVAALTQQAQQGGPATPNAEAQLQQQISRQAAIPAAARTSFLRDLYAGLHTDMSANWTREELFEDEMRSRMVRLEGLIGAPRALSALSEAALDTRVYFIAGSSELTGREQGLVRQIGRKAASADQTLWVLGFADARGPKAENVKLGQARADEVARLLEEQAATVIEHRGCGALADRAAQYSDDRVAVIYTKAPQDSVCAPPRS